MQEIIKFKLKGSTAIFRKPESNNVYFTYNNPHKIAILGILGSIIGENGYNYNNLFKDKAKVLPDFYNNLKNIKISIVPNSHNGNFNKYKQGFNNSVGYANINNKTPSILQVEEQWLEKPSWYIYILNDKSEKCEKIKDYLVNKKCEYIPYLGKNDHFADISEVEILSGDVISDGSSIKNINSIFYDIHYKEKEEFSFSAFMKPADSKDVKYTFKEIMPLTLDAQLGYTDYEEFIFTSYDLDLEKADNLLYDVDRKVLFFF